MLFKKDNYKKLCPKISLKNNSGHWFCEFKILLGNS